MIGAGTREATKIFGCEEVVGRAPAELGGETLVYPLKPREPLEYRENVARERRPRGMLEPAALDVDVGEEVKHRPHAVQVGRIVWRRDDHPRRLNRD